MKSLAVLSALLPMLLVPAAPSAAAGDWTWPVRGPVLTEFKNGDDPYAAGQHRGVDIGAPVGTPVVAASAGSVVFAGVVGSSGLVVSERTDDGRHELSYLHLSSLSVHRGDSVGRGERVGAVGVSGSRSVDQPHLHFGVRVADDPHAYLNPLDFLGPPPAEAPEPAPAPATVREPAPTAPATAPTVPAPASAPAFAPAPAHATARHGVGHLVDGVVHPLVRPVAHTTVAPASAPAPRGARPHAHHAPARRPDVAPGSGPAAAPVAGHAHAPLRPNAASHGGGIDVAWLAACAGLVVAAALLAAPRPGRPKRTTARATFGALLRAASRT